MLGFLKSAAGKEDKGTAAHGAKSSVAKKSAAPPRQEGFKPPSIGEVKAESVLTRRGGKYPAPAALRTSYALVQVSREVAVEYVTSTFPAENQTQQYYQLKAGIVTERHVTIHKQRIEVTPSDIRALYERIEGKKGDSADVSAAPIEEAKTIFNDVIAKAKEYKASDVHFIVRKDTSIVLFRVYGEITRYKQYDPVMLSGVLSAIYNKLHDEHSNSHATFSTKLASYCTVTIPEISIKLRWQTAPLGYDDSFDVIVRLISKGDGHVMSLEELGYLPSQARMLEMVAKTPRGGIFIAGVTGSGKSKTLQTMMSIVCKGGAKKVYSVEDPIEYPMFGVSQIMVQRNESTENNQFADIMKTLMRGDPDAIMAGEIRDSDTAQVAQDIIRTGHHLLTTVHANSAIGIVGRLGSRDIGMARDTLAEPDFLSALVYQHLVPTLCPHCKVKIDDSPSASDDELCYQLFSEDRYAIPRENVYVRGKGCDHCRNGTRGLTVCAEIILPGKDVKMLEMFREGKMSDALRAYRSSRIARYDDPDCEGKTAVEAGIFKVSQGIIDPNDLQNLFGAFGLEEIQQL